VFHHPNQPGDAGGDAQSGHHILIAHPGGNVMFPRP
jgi:hypothetical protein